MYNRLKWANPNGNLQTTVKIYRGDAPLDRNNLTALTPIATLTAGETEFNDPNVIQGNTYYYVFETIGTDDRVPSANYPITAIPRRGPGSGNLVAGDYNYGYFGSLTSSVFINTADLRAAVGTALGVAQNASPVWHKYARNGKVIYVPEGSLASGTSWTSIYNAGLVFGVDGPGPYNAGGADVNQKRQVTIGPDTYWVRLMRGYNDDYAVTPLAGSIAEPIEAFSCEWDDFVYPLGLYVPTTQRMANIAAFTSAQLGLNSLGAWVQERVSGSNPLTRGDSTASRQGLAKRVTTNAITANASGLTWWPVLELIEPPIV